MIRYALIGGFVMAAISTGYVLLDGRTLEPDRREIVIREVENGYVVGYRTANNPYPQREQVAMTPAMAAEIAKAFLLQPIPPPRWGQ